MTVKSPDPTMEPAPPVGNVEQIRKRLAEGWSPPVARLIGFRLEEIGRGRAKIVLRAGPRHANPMGTLHGGILCDIADAAMGMAYVGLISPTDSFTTIELKVNFLRPFWSGALTARGRILRKGRMMGLLECRITDEKRRLVAYATSTCMTLPGTPGEGLTRPRGGSNFRRATVKG
ncbi:MAG: PaaI family thioesterase [Thermoplasmata archaeon]